MSFKYKYDPYEKFPLRKTPRDWAFERSSHLDGRDDDTEHYWIHHCKDIKLVAAKYFDERYQKCPNCGKTPPKRFLSELNLDYVMRKYALES